MHVYISLKELVYIFHIVTGCNNIGGRRKYKIISESKPKFLLVRMQRWNGFAKDNGDIKVTSGFEYRDLFDNADITQYECISSLIHVGQSFKHGHYFVQKKIGK